ncbi:hypothetical protein [Xanthomonas cassavae]|uniref:hypothetical protein n=1 Tax=Xanthomonas cassavae TaxID=56450 RepID=UPI0004095C5B
MKLSSDMAMSSSSHATSPAPAHPVQTVAPPQTHLPAGPLAGLPTGKVLRVRRAALSGRATTDTSHAESSHRASHRSELSSSSESTDASFYTARASSASSVVEEPHAPGVAVSYAQRSASAAAKLKAQIRTRLNDLPFVAPSEEQEALQTAYLEWADARVQERIAAFGPDAGYQIVGDMKTAGAKAAGRSPTSASRRSLSGRCGPRSVSRRAQHTIARVRLDRRRSVRRRYPVR